jgi:hypothetical protein
MRYLIAAAYGATSQIYMDCKIGEGLPWHKHDIPHGHMVLSGRTRLEIEGTETVELKAGDPNRELPPNRLHQITALEDGTCFLNAYEGGQSIVSTAVSSPPPPYYGGILLDDGSVVYPT